MDLPKHLLEVAEINHPGASATRQALMWAADEIRRLRRILEDIAAQGGDAGLLAAAALRDPDSEPGIE